MPDNIFAAIDIGTNTFRLLIAEIHVTPVKSNRDTSPEEASLPVIRELRSERIITRLGEGITANGMISDRSMQKGLDALKTFSRIIAEHNVAKISAVATSALRKARNSKEFIDKVKLQAGLDIRTISGEDEARWTAAGMMFDIQVPDEAILIDIGGGSTELIYARNGIPLRVQSFELGVVYLAAKYMTDDPPSADMLHEMEREITGVIDAKTAAFDQMINSRVCLIGTAGTITTLAAMCLKLTSFDHDRIHRARISSESIRDIFSSIALISSLSRARYLPFEPERLDIIVPGTLILLKLMEHFHAHEITVSNYGLREGVILQAFKSED